MSVGADENVDDSQYSNRNCNFCMRRMNDQVYFYCFRFFHHAVNGGQLENPKYGRMQDAEITDDGKQQAKSDPEHPDEVNYPFLSLQGHHCLNLNL